MIRSFKNAASEKVFKGQRPNRFPGLDFDLAGERLDELDAALSLQSLSPLKSLGLHPLKGDRKGQWAITVNGRWRVCFRFQDGFADDVEITDYHKG
jgi:proteic killer suppression protein